MKKVPLIAIGVLVVLVWMAMQNRNPSCSGNPQLDAAIVQAKAENKHILIDFSGSDWCGWCIKLDHEVFSQDIFKDYARDNLVLVLVDFPQDKSSQTEEQRRQNKEFARCFNVQGFPTVLILKPDGKIIAKTGYQDGGADAYVAHIKKLIAEAE